MKTKPKLHSLFLITVLASLGGVHQAAAQGAAFTYQGRLNDGVNPANGDYDLTFSLFNAGTGGGQVGGTLTNSATVVSNGLFTTTLDFGAGVFTGPDLWLDISVRTNGGGAFTELVARQPLTPAPYAVFANTAGSLAGGLSIQQNTNGAPNVIAGSINNSVSAGVIGATIGGGGATNNAGASYVNSVTANFGTVGGGGNNSTGADWATVGGGYLNIADDPYATVAGGNRNLIQSMVGDYSVIGGGNQNRIIDYVFFSDYIGSTGTTIAGGEFNFAVGNAGTIGGGISNVVNNLATAAPTVAGGLQNEADNYGAVGGGYGNLAQASGAVPGGWKNAAEGNYSFAAGQQAQALNDGTFVWADSQNASFASTSSNQFVIRAQGGVGVNTASPQQDLSVNGGMNVDQASLNTGTIAHALSFGSGSGEGLGSIRTTGFADSYGSNISTDIATRMTILQHGNVGIGTTNPANLLVVGGSASPAYCNGTTWVNGSDRNSKEGFAAINPRVVLEKVSALPITEWKYKVEADGTAHLGPMAQDFHAAFGLNGADDKHIATVDEEGVALAAIQGLNQKLEETRAELKARDAEIQDLRQSLAELKRLVQAPAARK